MRLKERPEKPKGVFFGAHFFSPSLLEGSAGCGRLAPHATRGQGPLKPRPSAVRVLHHHPQTLIGVLRVLVCSPIHRKDGSDGPRVTPLAELLSRQHFCVPFCKVRHMGQSEASPKPVGRIRAAFHVLVGRRTTPQMIEAEWLEYKQIFDDVLTRLGAQLARQAKAHKDDIRRNLDLPTDSPPQGPVNAEVERAQKKAELNRKAARMRGIGLPAQFEMEEGL